MAGAEWSQCAAQLTDLRTPKSKRIFDPRMINLSQAQFTEKKKEGYQVESARKVDAEKTRGPGSQL
jgi:hypothetical protein